MQFLIGYCEIVLKKDLLVDGIVITKVLVTTKGNVCNDVLINVEFIDKSQNYYAEDYEDY